MGVLKKNPTLGITKFKEESRVRYLISEEIQNFFEVLEKEVTPPMKDYVYISLYTGARKGNGYSQVLEKVKQVIFRNLIPFPSYN